MHAHVHAAIQTVDSSRILWYRWQGRAVQIGHLVKSAKKY